ncbi:MAG: hypothetical protein E6Q97_32665 [Desulfurellales bacterium]|nr:MAG: hypothetical protein E6Q97_32665 [Desulfurellales bacterium]
MSMIDEPMAPADPTREPMPENPIEAAMPEVPRPRRRLRSVTIDRTKVAERVVKFYQDDLESRSEDRQRRIQRYAKFRMWTEEKNWPWVGSSNMGLPDMLEKSLRVQDTLHNAVMASRPGVFNAKAASDANKGKEDVVTKLLDYQVFVEANGEKQIGTLIDSYVNDGCFTALTTWVKERRDVCERMEYPLPPENEDFFQYLNGIVQNEFPQALDIYPDDEEGWEWCVELENDEKVRVSFYTEEDDNDAGESTILAVIKKAVVTHDGPVIIPFDYDDVITPPGVSNLQIPGPANPGGSPHVILRSYPTLDEIRHLAAAGYYDLITPEELEALKPEMLKPSNDHVKKEALDKLQGQSQWKMPHDNAHGTLTRLMVFDRYDLDGDGLAEDVVFWVLEEPRIVLRARHLTEVFPAKVPRRPLAEATFIPAGDRREGVSLLEMQEGVHDVQKMLFDITVDSGTLGAMPIFFYRMSGAVKPENLQLFPGMGVPVGDPGRDVMFPNITNTNGLSMLLNLITMAGNWGDRATVIGDFQLGRVPTGKSSALRTTGAVSMLQAQGDARPERILRRLFNGLGQIYANIHDLNCAFLPRGKQFRISGVKRPDEDPYLTVEGREKIDGIYEFEFEANAFNTSKAMLQQSLMQYAQMLLSPIGIQSGLVKPDGMYTLMRDLGKALGLSPDKYVTAPNPEASLPLISAEDAITQILESIMPYGRPQEGTQAHIEKLAQFYQDDAFGQLDEKQVQMFGEYIRQLGERLQQEQMQAMMAQAAAQFQQQMGGGGPGGAPTQNAPQAPGGPPPVSGGELMDESLPTAGGGGQDMQMAAE